MKGFQKVTGVITKIVQVTDGARPQTGPISTIPIQIEAETLADQMVLEISTTAAAELVEALSKVLRGRDSQ